MTMQFVKKTIENIYCKDGYGQYDVDINVMVEWEGPDLEVGISEGFWGWVHTEITLVKKKYDDDGKLHGSCTIQDLEDEDAWFCDVLQGLVDDWTGDNMDEIAERAAEQAAEYHAACMQERLNGWRSERC